MIKKNLAINNKTCIHLAAKLLKTVVTGKFLGLHINNADYSVQQALPRGWSFMKTDTFRLLYCTYWHFHSIPSCRVCFWGKVFNIEKDQMKDRCQEKIFCRKICNKVNIFPLPVNVYSDYCPSLQTAWKVFKQIHNYTAQTTHTSKIYTCQMLTSPVTRRACAVQGQSYSVL